VTGDETTAALNWFITQLEDAADHIGDIPRHKLQMLVSCAAPWLRRINVEFVLAAGRFIGHG
jgi:hypothetical protein